MVLLQDSQVYTASHLPGFFPTRAVNYLKGRGLGTGLIMDGLYFGFMAVFGHRYMSVGATTVSADKIYSIVLLNKTTSTILPPVLLVTVHSLFFRMYTYTETENYSAVCQEL